MNTKAALGRGLGSLIPQKHSLTEQVIPSARKEILEIRVGEIRENPHQPRQHFSPSDLKDLIASIKEHGILVPLIVTREKSGYELVAGERRFRAAKTLGLKTVPAIVRDATEQQKLEFALIENIQRQDLNAFEEAVAYRALIDEFALTQEQVAARVGKSRSAVANIVRLLDLPPDMIDAVKTGAISKSHARTLLSESDAGRQRLLFESMLRGPVTVREVEARVESHRVRAHMRTTQGKDPNIVAHEKRLREILGTKVDIVEKKGKGNITIAFFSREELHALLGRLSD